MEATDSKFTSLDLGLKKRFTWRYGFERGIVFSLAACALVSVVTTLAIMGVLSWESMAFFEQISWKEVFTESRWAPLIEPRSFGIWPLISGTLLVAVIAGLISMPCGLAIAVFLNESAGPRLRAWLKPILELLAGIPSVVFGYFALATITPVLQNLIPNTEVFNALSAGLVVGVMTIPLVASMSDDAISSVPQSLRENGYALGATRYEVMKAIVIPSALSGILASFILAFSRAVGETMAVTMAAGATPNLTVNPLQSVQTMTAYIAQVSMGDTPHGTIEYQSIFVVGMLLFVITLVTNLLAQFISKKLRMA